MNVFVRITEFCLFFIQTVCIKFFIPYLSIQIVQLFCYKILLISSNFLGRFCQKGAVLFGRPFFLPENVLTRFSICKVLSYCLELLHQSCTYILLKLQKNSCVNVDANKN